MNIVGNDKLVSIIIPIYNSEKLLERTLKSVLNQSYKNIEVLLINDGSKDKSEAICERYRQIDSRVRLFTKSNGGTSSARNLGLHNMTGTFCQFVDSDDVLPQNFTEVMVRKIQQGDCDAAFSGVMKIWDDKIHLFNLEDKAFSVDGYLYELYRGRIATKSACIGIYKSDVIRKNNIEFPENICCGEDSIFVLRYLKYCKKIISVHDTIYQYMYDNSNSATRAVYYDHFLIEMERYDLANEIIKNEKVKGEIAQFYMDSAIRELFQYITCSTETYSNKLKSLKKYVNNIGTKYAIKYYKRNSIKKSWIIPRMIRYKNVFFLYFFLKIRGKSMDKDRFANMEIKSAYR